MVDHFGLGRQQSSPSFAPPPNARVRSYRLGPSLLSVFLSTLLKQPPVARRLLSPPFTRNQRRRFSRLLKKSFAPPRFNAGIRANKLHRSTPLRLRQRGYVASRPPTLAQRDDFRHFATLKERALRLQRRADKLRNSRRPAPLPPTTGQKGEGYKNKRSCPSWCSKRPRSPPRTAKYCPVAPANSPDPFAIAPLTFHQRAAANKILSHVHLACHSTPLRMALQAPARMREALGPKANTSPIIWDSGASISITPDISDFEGPVTSPGTITQLKGIAKGLQIKGQGEVTWAVHDQLGNLRLLKVPAFHVPNIKVRLLSTSSLLQTYPDETITIEPNRLTLSGVPNDVNRGPVTANVNPQNNLPTSEAYNATDPFKAADALVSIVNTVHERNLNLNEAEKELLRWHYRLGHVGFKKVQFILRSGVVSKTEESRRLQTAACRLTSFPNAPPANMANNIDVQFLARRLRLLSKIERTLLKQTILPGQRISVDHFICSTRGRLLTSAGKTKLDDMYTGGCIFVDHASGYIFVEHRQLELARDSQGKESFERMSQHRSDAARVSRRQLKNVHVRRVLSQPRRVPTSHPIRWRRRSPSQWNRRTQHSYNHGHRKDHDVAFGHPLAGRRRSHTLAPRHSLGTKEIDGRPRLGMSSLRPRQNDFGRQEIATLDSSFDSHGQPRFLGQTRQLGPSRSQSTNGYTPQFHIVFDDWFATVPASADDLPNFNDDSWKRMFQDSTFQYVLDDEDEERLIVESTDYEQANELLSQMQRVATARQRDSSSGSSSRSASAVNSVAASKEQVATPPPVVVPPPCHSVVDSKESPTPIRPANESDKVSEQPIVPKATKAKSTPLNTNLVAPLAIVGTCPPRIRRTARTWLHRRIRWNLLEWLYNEVAECLSPPPSSYKASVSDPDTLSFSEAMADHDNIEKWLKAANDEIQSLQKNGTWIEVPITEAKTRILPGTWVFRRKRTPDGTISKYKARYCVRGDLQENVQETFAPVVAWSTVRLFLVLSNFELENLHHRLQQRVRSSPLSDPVWIHLPRGFHSERPRHVPATPEKPLWLEVWPRLWYQHLSEALREEGFKACANDPCLLYKDTIMVVLYVDDLGIAYRDQSDLDKLFANLEAKT
ncbi:hypothetical protein MHU86_25511 [Fragilaria crotonensis]|nr:hypothetical protein MHU86_25511 [Fragilaria crotonensis]